MNSEPVFLAADTREADRVERVLEGAGVEYSVRLDAVMENEYRGPCYQGILYEVAAERAPECRRLILDKGLSAGVIYTK